MKDILGLIKYLFLILFIVISPIAWFWLFFVPWDGTYSDEWEIIQNLSFVLEDNNIFAGIHLLFTILFLGLPFIYLYCTIYFTIKAINDHWSKYLDFFFNSFFLMTLFLILICKGVSIFATGKTINILNFNIDTFYITLPCLFILPVYFIIYMTVILKYPSKEITNAPKFIILLNKIPKWLLFIILAFIYLTNGYIYAIIALTCFSVLLNIRKY